MKVILVEDVKTLGKKGDTVKVSDGYARNLLFPKNLAVEATPKNINDLKLQKEHAARAAQKQLEDAQAFAAKLAQSQVKVSMKVGEGGKVFGSVSGKEIAEAAKEQLGYEIDKKKIQMAAPIKAVGLTSVSIRLHPKVTAELKVLVEGI